MKYELLTLVQHLDRLSEHRPRSAVRRVCVAGCMDIWPRLVQRGMDHETSRVDFVLSGRHGDALFGDQDQVTGIDQCEVYSVGVWAAESIVSQSS